MSVLTGLYEKTLILKELVSTHHPGDRDQTIEQVQRILDERDLLLVQLPANPTEEELRLGAMIVEMDDVIINGLERILKGVTHDRQMIKEKKSISQRYRNPYSNIAGDGMFLDKKE
ncbi:hypothetical protein EV207_12069 [Scopulibacillus darangshiensis]|uniref:Flagellar protein FliT n=1 Tax=Scopulibacillus darangshiensis TaxID=442528 RepID=A0A4R2NX89_9BACL|nr:hypothetical protein [Scopulibacillus darangshiensis]TCP26035.1 hypothetical protein EV207_12069 [Scopulibacillus darangshiensis]